MNQDLRFAIRSLKNNRWLTVLIIVTLGLGIGVNTAVYSLLNGILVKALPFEHAEKLVQLHQYTPQETQKEKSFAVADYQDLKREISSLTEVIEYHSMNFTLLGYGVPERVKTAVISANYFQAFGIDALYGRTFHEGEDKIGSEPVLLLSNEFWLKKFAGDPNILGQQLEMNDRLHTIIGILPQLPAYPDHNDIYMPASSCPFRTNEQAINNREIRLLKLFGKMAPHSSLKQINEEVKSFSQILSNNFPQIYQQSSGYHIGTTLLKDEINKGIRNTLFLLMFITLSILLIACANVANLTIAKQVGRQQELATRTVLGASRKQIIKLLLLESTLVALIGGVLGILIAYLSLDFLINFAAQFTIRADEITIDINVLIFTLLLALITGIIFGLMALPPKIKLMDVLKSGGKNTMSQSQGSHMRKLLIITQLCFAVVLLISSGLLVKSVYQLQEEPLGFDPNNVLVARLSLNWSKYSNGQDKIHDQSIINFINLLLDQIKNIQNIDSVGISSSFPLSNNGPRNTKFLIEGQESIQQEYWPSAEFFNASTGYFQSLGMQLLSGRYFNSFDDLDSPKVAIINQQLAQKLWNKENPIGKKIRYGESDWIQIIGIISNIKQTGIAVSTVDTIYLPFTQSPSLQIEVLVRSLGEQEILAKKIKQIVESIDPQQPVHAITSLQKSYQNTLAPSRFMASLLGIFSVLALLIAISGIIGVVSYSVLQRTQEIGVRLALGSSKEQVIILVMKHTLILVSIGIVIGTIIASFTSYLLIDLLYRVEPWDSTIYIFVPFSLLIVAMIASLVPARKAASVNPMIALRAE